MVDPPLLLSIGIINIVPRGIRGRMEKVYDIQEDVDPEYTFVLSQLAMFLLKVPIVLIVPFPHGPFPISFCET